MDNQRINYDFVKEFISIAGIDSIKEAISLYKSSCDIYISDSLKNYKDGDILSAASELHKIKGASNSIGLVLLSKEIQNIENELKAKDLDYPLEKKLTTFKESLIRDVALLDQFINENLVA
ncbi:MAG: Hpt domain-containing protein [Succinivibrionaceae bacterium]